MTLVVDELYPGIVFEQKFRIQESIQLAHFRPWFYKHGSPSDGEMVLQVSSEHNILREARISSEDINEQIPGTFAHGQLRFDVSPLKLNHNRKQEWTEFKVAIFMDGYTLDTSNFYGLVRRYEQEFLPVYGEFQEDGVLFNSMIAPLGFELYKVGY